MRMTNLKNLSSCTVRRHSAGGFTLIELMIVVAVVAILAAFALPSYQEHIRKSRRAQAKADIVEYMQLAERFHTVNNTYSGFTLPSAVSPREAAGGGTAHYSLAIDGVADAKSIKIKATAQGGQVEDKCGDLSINQAGVKANSKGTLASCW